MLLETKHHIFCEKTFVKKAVKISPMQSAGDLLNNVQETNNTLYYCLAISSLSKAVYQSWGKGPH